MSATVTYKGATLTTATNQTRTLDTAGTYLEDDITLTDVSTIPSGTKSITTNGTHDVTNYASANVAVPASAVDSGTKSVSITSNGTTTEDVTGYASASITTNVPNSYTSSDEGKVVSNGSLVSQSSATYTENDTYDTTLVDEVTVNVSGGGGISVDDIASASITGDIVITESEIKAGAFWGNNGITSVTATNATTIGENALKGLGTCTIKVPNVVTVGKEAFGGTGADLYLPKITAISSSYWGTTGASGTILALPGLTGSIPSDGLRSVYATILDLGYITQIKTRGIYQGNWKTVVILRSSSVVTASEQNAIAAIGPNTTVYVPSALVSSYQSATGWSARGCTFTALEGSPYEEEDWAA